MRGRAVVNIQISNRPVRRPSVRGVWAVLVTFWLLASSSAFGQAVLVGENIDPTSPANQQVWRDRFRGQDSFLEDNDFKADLEHVQRIIQTPVLATQRLEPLAKRVNAVREVNPRLSNVEALEQALTELEARHSFSTARIVPAGILSEENFFKFPESGFILRDEGAGPEHGEFAHRLQWAMIMSDYEKDFEEKTGKWHFTPLELYIKIFQRDQQEDARERADKAQGDKQALGAISLFAHLFDQGGVDHRDGADGYRHPDRLTKDLRDVADRNKQLKDKGVLYHLADAVKQRFEERKAERDRNQYELGRKLSEAIKERLTKNGEYIEFEENSNVFVHKDSLKQVRREFDDGNTKARRIAESRGKWGQGSVINMIDALHPEFKTARPPRPEPIKEVDRLNPEFEDAPPRPEEATTGRRADDPGVHDVQRGPEHEASRFQHGK